MRSTASPLRRRRACLASLVVGVLAAGVAAFDVACSSSTTPSGAPSADDDAAAADGSSAGADASTASATDEDASDADIADAALDSPEDCAVSHQRLAMLFDGSTCGECVETKCAGFFAACTSSCNCTTGLDVLFQCLELGGSGSDCQDKSFPYLPTEDYAPAYQCKVDCLYSCSVLEAGPDE